MPDMYDKLGEMLNEALESGEIPQNSHCEDDKTDYCEGEPLLHCEDMDCFDAEASRNEELKKSNKPTENHNYYREENLRHCKAETLRHCEAEGRSNPPTGEVIKLHKYAYNMQFPPIIQQALTTLDIAYPFTSKDIKKQYRKLLKEIHPDTKNTIQNSQDVENYRQKTVDEITEAYKILCQFFSIK